VRNRETKEPATPEDTLRIVRQAVSNGVVVMRAGLFSNGIRLLPALNMREDMLREGLDALARAIETVAIEGAAVST
jgi:4-aminobutyrate aminotransferase/(S)-3-amino-2-methylpropionate transaminase